MNSTELNAMQAASTSKLRQAFDGLVKEKAEHLIDLEVQQRIEAGMAFKLSDDEERLLLAYRRFVARSRPGMVFSWQTPNDDPSGVTLVLPSEPALIHDPREVVV